MANMTRLDGVNRILMNCGCRPVAAVDTNGASEAADAERILDFESRSAQLAAWHDNVIPCVKHIASATGDLILGSTVIGIKGAGQSRHRSFSMIFRGGQMKVYDLNRATFTFTANEEIFLDLIYQEAFEEASPMMQEIILKQATVVFQRQFKNNPAVNQELKEESLRAQAMADRSTGSSSDPNTNPPPFSVRSPAGPGGN